MTVVQAHYPPIGHGSDQPETLYIEN
jgi:hypothetical protein